MTRTCTKCGIEKQEGEFNFRSKENGTYDSHCRECKHKAKIPYSQKSEEYKKAIRERVKNYRKNNPEVVKNAWKKYIDSKPQGWNYERSKDYRKRNRLKEKNSYLQRTYNIDLSFYEKLHIEQEGKCAICKKHETWSTKGTVADLAVDHKHDENRTVRGLLCNRCNRVIGQFEDSIELLESAINYLKKYQ